MAALHSTRAIDPTLISALLASAEKIINAALAYDPATRIALSKLEPQLLAVVLTAPALTIFIAPRADGIHLLGYCESSVTTQIQGSLPALMSLLKSERINLKDSGVEVMGSTHFLAELQHILQQLEIDWEEMLAQLVGDIAGHQTAELIRSKLRWGSDRIGNIQRLASEFLSEELQILPSKAELGFFNRQVDDIQMDVDRLAARIEQLAKRI